MRGMPFGTISFGGIAVLTLLVVFVACDSLPTATPGPGTTPTTVPTPTPTLAPVTRSVPPWLRDVVARLEDRSGRVLGNPNAVVQYQYHGQVVYSMSYPCCDRPNRLYDAEGAFISHIGGMGVIPNEEEIAVMREFSATSTNPLLIWSDARARVEQGQVLAPSSVTDVYLAKGQTGVSNFDLIVVAHLTGCASPGGYVIKVDEAAVSVRVFDHIPARPSSSCEGSRREVETIIHLWAGLRPDTIRPLYVNGIEERVPRIDEIRAATPTPTPAPTLTLPTDLSAQSELLAIVAAVATLMAENDLGSIISPVTVNRAPCTTGTQHMTEYPDTGSIVGTTDKPTDRNGTAYVDGVDPLGDKDGYLLVGHDITGDNAQTSLVDYIGVAETVFCYTIDPDGTVGQYTVDSVHIGEVASF